MGNKAVYLAPKIYTQRIPIQGADFNLQSPVSFVTNIPERPPAPEHYDILSRPLLWGSCLLWGVTEYT